MIRYLSGTIIEQVENFITLENAGIGYQIFIPSIVIDKKQGSTIGLWIADIVREDSHDLYGFLESGDVRIFDMLTSVSGVGPKLGHSILHSVPQSGLIRAIAGGDSGYLSSLPGIGRKTAEKIILELRDRAGVMTGTMGQTGTVGTGHQDVIDGLVGLGFPERSVREALLTLDTADMDTGTMMKEIMKILSQ